MASLDPTPVLFVTANVGSIFEDPNVMLHVWTQEFLATVTRLKPLFLAVHCQEVGGKNYEHSMQYVKNFVSLLMDSNELKEFDRTCIYLDEDFPSVEKFTALGSLYFIHKSVTDVQIWDFEAHRYVDIVEKTVFSGNIEDVVTKEKAKFPQDFFPECKWSRKGFLRTRWRVKGTQFDLINIHLFHDASNFVAMEEFPSVYSNNRQRALQYMLDRFHGDKYDNVPFFIFGDFNFRVDTQSVVKLLTSDLSPEQMQCNKTGEKTKLQFRDTASQVILTVGVKEFLHQDHQKLFFHEAEWLREHDKELEPFRGRLSEFQVDFPPSYPFEEEVNGSQTYMTTRCPAWCDRIVFSSKAKHLVASPSSELIYSIMGSNVCMGDHKPVYLRFDLASEAGIILCCTPEHPCSYHSLETAPPTLPTQSIDRARNEEAAPEADATVTVKKPHPHFNIQRHFSSSAVETSQRERKYMHRCASELSRSNTGTNVRRRVRLISEPSQLSMRLQSHHSSSSEEWFEEIPEEESMLDTLRNRANSFPLQIQASAKPQELAGCSERPANLVETKKADRKHWCCCVVL